MKRPPTRSFVVASMLAVGALAASILTVAPSWRASKSWVRSFGPSPAIASMTGGEVDTIADLDDSDVPLLDDVLADKNPRFDPTLVDRRPFGSWRVNTSGAVVRVDAPKPLGGDGGDRPLVANYAAAMAQGGPGMLASINLIDGKAKQFDDGLYAAIDRAYYSGDPGLGSGIEGHLALIGRMLAVVAPGSAASDFLAAGLSLDARHLLAIALSPNARRMADRFRADEIRSKPIGFYTWDATLGDCFRVLRFFSRPITEPPTVNDLAKVLRDDPDLLARYRKATSFYAGLTNPLEGLSLAEFAVDSPPPMNPATEVSLFPASTSREVELFRRLFPKGPPPNAQLMKALVVAIRSGRVDLAPDSKSGWYEHQAFALETMLLPERGEAADHILLTKAYKERALAAFEALLAKRRETHARQLQIFAPTMMVRRLPPPTPPIKPRFRVEPNPSYYLRTARSYDFVAHLLEATFGAEALGSIHGLRQSGPRPDPLGVELRSMRDLFLGFYLLSSEDLGHRPALSATETARRGPAEAAATAWLDRIAADPTADPDLSADTRVAVPIGFDPKTRKVRLWATIGVSLVPLEARYVRPPQIRPLDGGDWRKVQPSELETAHQFIAVDEFAEIELDGGRVLNRDELRAICDTHKTRDAIRQALGAIR